MSNNSVEFAAMYVDYSDTPLIAVNDKLLDAADVQLLVKREDLNHPEIAGNKWWKLKYNLAAASDMKLQTVLTFGGAYSNHIYASAAAAKALGFKSIGVIRGERIHPLNRTLTYAENQGMQLHFIGRENYKTKEEPEFIQSLHNLFGDFYLIPEGGTNVLAVKGCTEFALQHLNQIECDHIYLPVGTGGTMAGLICAFKGLKPISGVSVLKDGAFLIDDIQKLVINFSGTNYGNWDVLTSYHHGGYAKVSEALNRFIVKMKVAHNLPLDPVYTAKLFYAIFQEVEKGAFQRGTTILAIHTGGLQGVQPTI